mmetsp:Transcript_65380/g.116335  ORF Transcript_65380/g.116335 Transcript_65380/m.116335 type:complete len:190 (-) Transcript_65380:1069-1638(-)
MATVRPFYGGAITGAIPPGYIDASDIRQVPDNQEVFIDPQTDACIIIELLSLTPNVSLEDLAPYHFKELAKENAADFHVGECQVMSDDTMPHLPPTKDAYKQVIKGTQTIAKFKEAAANLVTTYLAVVRLAPPLSTEILISLSAPSEIHPESSSKGLQPMGGNKELCDRLFTDLLRSFHIRDFGLFVPE